MDRNDKLMIAAIILLLLLLGWLSTPAALTALSGQVPTPETTLPKTGNGTPGNPAPALAPQTTVPVFSGHVGATGTPDAEILVPAAPATTVPQETGVTPATGASRGLYHQCILVDGKVRCIGKDLHGALGRTNGDGHVDLPVRVEEVIAGQGSTCARGEGRVFCWGYRQGLGATDTAEPREIAVPASAKIYNGQGGIVCSASFTEGGLNQKVGIDNGVLHCWGEGIEPAGLTGRGFSDQPVEIARSKDFDDVAVGWRSVCTLTGDVVLKCYGGQPDKTWSVGGKVVAKDTGFHRVSVSRVDETHDRVCAHYWDGTKQCFG